MKEQVLDSWHWACSLVKYGDKFPLGAKSIIVGGIIGPRVLVTKRMFEKARAQVVPCYPQDEQQQSQLIRIPVGTGTLYLKPLGTWDTFKARFFGVPKGQ